MKSANIIISMIALAIVMVIIVAMPPIVLDVLLVISLALSILILIITFYIREPLEFSIFPSLLLLTTLLRLALNISATRLILGNGANAGSVIRTFGSFVIGNEIVVGIIIFLIIVMVQFVVITKGSERVAEVAARFTLDAMPGKQMAIDADLNSGIIDEQGAKERRLKVQREADFYGAMDGASKFLKGDAIMGILITIVNIVGGLIVAATSGGDTNAYILVSVGSGLINQISALLISAGMGIVVTRAASENALGEDLARQMFSQPLVLMITGGVVAVMGIIPGMPTIPMFLLGGAFIFVGVSMRRAAVVEEGIMDEDEAEAIAAEKRRPESVTTLLQVDPIELEFGYGIIPLVDTSQGGDLLDRVVMIRRQCALDLGIIVPVIRLRDNIQLTTNQYVIKIKGAEVARGEVMVDHYLALDSGGASGEIKGIDTTEPAFGLSAKWITESEREKADLLGYTTIDTPSVIATHLTEIIKRFGFELLNRQQVQTLIENLKQTQPALCDEVVPKMFSLGEIQKVLANLLRENIPIKDMGSIIETMADYGGLTRDTDLLTEYVRQSLKRTITRRFVPDGKARVITLDPSLEQLIVDRVKQTEQGSYVAMEPENVQRLFKSLQVGVERVTEKGLTPIVLTSPMVRKHFKRLVEPLVPDLTVLSFNELESNIEIYSDGMVRI